ncbi:MAG: hypothetical protein JXA57_04210 [Armatimonadetes bacterium]|nr:hypothetical protein [Armatimonadota bacterium]
MRFSEIDALPAGLPGLYEIRLLDGSGLKIGIAKDVRKRLMAHRRSPDSGLRLKPGGVRSNPSDVVCKRSILGKHLYYDEAIAPGYDLKTQSGRQQFLLNNCTIDVRFTTSKEAARELERRLEASGDYRYVGNVVSRVADSSVAIDVSDTEAAPEQGSPMSIHVPHDCRRGISPAFEAQLREGILQPILMRVLNDDTLSLEIRNGYVDIYYRGGRLLGLHSKAQDTKCSTQFDERYFGDSEAYPAMRPPKTPEKTICTRSDAQTWVDAFAYYKQAMDIRFSLHPKIEREYQQAVVRDNNRHWSGDASDYVVVDVEYAQSPRAFPDQKTNYRFDMVGFRWPAKGKTRASGLVTPVIMEMKAGDGALTSPVLDKESGELSPGLVKHVHDIERFLTPDRGCELAPSYELLCEELVEVFATKRRLGLRSIPKRMRNLEITEVSSRPEVLFVIANHQPASRILRQELAQLPQTERADYYIATVTYAGYALFADNLMTIDQVLALETEPGHAVSDPGRISEEDTSSTH